MSERVATSAEVDTIRLDLPASLRYLAMLGPCVAELLAHVDGVADRDRLIHSVHLGVHEVCTNIIEHAYDGLAEGRVNIAFTLDESARCLTIVLDDRGHSFEPSAVRVPDPDQPQVRGYGLMLLRQLLDEVRYEALPGGNRWSLLKRW